MQLIYLIQLLFLLGAFVYGYRVALSPYRTVLFALAWQLLYGLLIWGLYDDRVAVLDIFDMIRLEKEFWLPNLVKWIGARFGRDIRFVYDSTFFLLTFTGGLLITISTVLAGNLLYQALNSVRLTEIRTHRDSRT